MVLTVLKIVYDAKNEHTAIYCNTLKYKKVVLSQWKPRDAAVNFDAYRILPRNATHSAVMPQYVVRLSVHLSVRLSVHDA